MDISLNPALNRLGRVVIEALSDTLVLLLERGDAKWELRGV